MIYFSSVGNFPNSTDLLTMLTIEIILLDVKVKKQNKKGVDAFQFLGGLFVLQIVVFFSFFRPRLGIVFSLFIPYRINSKTVITSKLAN